MNAAPQSLAAIDLGSNTFRMALGELVGDVAHHTLQTHDAARALVSLARGLDAQERLTPEAMARAVQALADFHHRLAHFTPGQVRAVATSAFRRARNAAQFLPQAQAALGFPIEVISGLEEARLIYLGVIQDLPARDERRLVIDIGGGSTEFIAGHGTQALELASLPLGCTLWTQRFFPNGELTAARFEAATQAAREAIAPLAARYRAAGWQAVYGTSGTVKGVLAVLLENGLSHDGITRAGLVALMDALSRIGVVRLADWAGLKPARASVLGGGLAILLAAFDVLHIAQPMHAGNGALRIGLLHDLALRRYAGMPK